MRKTALRKNNLHWLENLVIIGREDDDPYERDAQGQIIEDDGEQKLREGWEFDENDKPVKIDDEGDDDEEDEDDKNVPDDQKTPEQLRRKIADQEEAIRKERRLRRQAERDARKTKKAPAKKTAQSTQQDEEAQEKVRLAEARAQRLAEGLLTTKIDQAILVAARKAGFIDETDALTDAVRADVDYDQDEDDPSDIEIDLDSVKDAVADLANKKKHLVGRGLPGEPSASRQKRRRKAGDDDELSEQALVGNYPGLR
jgi:hypothetical protein